MNYEKKYFNNFKELKEFDTNVAERLSEYVNNPETEWQDVELCFYPTLEDYAKYEFFDGWYSELVKNIDNTQGAPKLSLYFDFTTLGKDLCNSWSNSFYYHDKETDCVISTSYSWFNRKVSLN